jgi:hypothetical protein
VSHSAQAITVGRSASWAPQHRVVSFTLLGASAVAVTAVATLRSPQLGCTVALLLLVATAQAAQPAAGVTALVLTWLVAPGIRRVLGYEAGTPTQDPLSIAPFLATGVVALMTAWRFRIPRLITVLGAVVCAGMLFGLAGAAGHLSAAVYSLVAYLSAFGALLIGWREGVLPLERWTLVRVLAVAAPLLALYALYQYFIAMPVWDQRWLDTVDFTSIGAPEAGKIRSFASVNSPGLLGTVLALSMVLYAGRRGLLRWASVALVITAAGLSVTYVRGAWLALAIAAVVFVLTSGRQAPRRLARIAVLMTVAVSALSATGGTYTAIVDRISTFGSLGSDQSARARQATPTQTLPELVGRPLGFGLGSAGEATRLAKTPGLRAPDNGYLAMAYQLGLLGGLLVIGSLLTAMAIALRRLYARGDPDRALLSGVFVFFLISLLSGDGFYGFAGITLWYFIGAALGRSHAGGEAASTLAGT